ncbi:MAG: DeoR/GlpR family DNA-binding transcription regulator [Armatimonadota bacterium]
MDERKSQIVEILGHTGRVGVNELAKRFGVSGMTIRRDLDELQRLGLVVRTHGGAVSSGKLLFMHATLPASSVSPAKRAIGKKAAELVQPGQTVMVDTGTTALEVARHIPRDPSITVVTTSLGVAQELYRSGLTVFVLGGVLRQDFPSVYGSVTERLLQELRVDLLFMGCDGAFSDDGFYTNDLHVCSIEQIMIRVAHRVIVVTESSKFGRRAFARYAPVEAVSAVVTDAQISAQDRQNLADRGVEVIITE